MIKLRQTPRFALIAPGQLLSVAIATAQTAQPSKSEPVAVPALVGYIGSPKEMPSEVWLAGGWLPGKGWLLPRKELAARWRAAQWTSFSSPTAPPVIIRTQPEPVTADDEANLRYTIVQPGGTGLVTTAVGRIRPRTAKSQDRLSVNLKKWTSTLLKQHRISSPSAVRVTGAWRVDLDGNGIDEVLWTARSRDAWKSPYFDPAIPGHALPSDYALLALSYRNGTNVIPRALAVGSATAKAPNYRILCPLDIDGDGRLEVYAHANYFEEHGLLAFSFDGKKLRGLLGTSLPLLKTGSPAKDPEK